MSHEFAEQLKQRLEVLRSRGASVVHRSQEESESFEVAGSRYRVVITVAPRTWIGLQFVLVGKGGESSSLDYDIDTDLYSESRERNLYADIERRVLEFLDTLTEGKIRVGTAGDRIVAIVPTSDGALVISRGRFGITTTVTKDSKNIESRGVFASLIP